MEDFFTNFFESYTKEIHDFFDFDGDILYITGQNGIGKSSLLKSALNSYDKEILKFNCLCFKNSTIDDFLLSFYDTFRKYALEKAISFKKPPEDSFFEKVSFYFKNLECKVVVVIDNYETILNNLSIADLIVHISRFENVKVVIISSEASCDLIQNPTVNVKKILFDNSDILKFEEALKSKFENAPMELIEKLFAACYGHELYLKMVITYLDSMKISLEDFLFEYENKDVPFAKFIIEKQISLLPQMYLTILENFAFITHNVSMEFIDEYKLCSSKEISYLLSKYMLSEFWGTYYIKSYLIEHFIEKLTVQNKILRIKNIISIYENELKKSPKDRLLRLSRESIRKQIQTLNEICPNVQKMQSSLDFEYAAQVKRANPKWFENAMALKKKKTKEKRTFRKENEKPFFELLIKSACELEEKYQYKKAAEILLKSKEKITKYEEKIILYTKAIENLIKAGAFSDALFNIKEISNIAKLQDDINLEAKFKIDEGNLYKKIYSFKEAKNAFFEVIKFEGKIQGELLASAHFALGELLELEENVEDAINEYEMAIEILEEKNPLFVDFSYKLALLLDENGFFEKAAYWYKKGISAAIETNNNKYLQKIYVNLGTILLDSNNNKEGLDYLFLALEIAKNNDNIQDIYYITKNIAEVYKNLDPETSYYYLNQAFEYANKLNDPYEIAISYIGLGDYFYDTKQNEQALICYFQAKSFLFGTTKENLKKIETRINDMHVKLGNYIFNGVKELYDGKKINY